MMQVTLGLVFVLALIAGLAWSVSRLRGFAPASQAPLKVIGAVSVGTRERVVIVEVGGQWLVVGVASGGVTLLDKTAPQLLHAANAANAANAAGAAELPKFAAWLRNAMQARR